MCHSACPVAVVLVHQPDLEEQVVENQEKQAPLHEGHIQPLEPLLAEGPWVGKILLVKEIACSDKEHRHVEQVDEGHQQGGTLGMTGTHQDDGKGFANRQIGISGIVCFHVTKKSSASARNVSQK